MQILICIITGIFWAIFDITRKLCLKNTEPRTLLIIFSLVQIIFFSAWSIKESFFLKILPYSLPGIILVLIGIFSALIFLKSIKESDLSLTIPLLSFSPLFSSFFSLIVLDEELNIKQFIGILGVILGTLVLYSDKLHPAYFLKSFSNIIHNSSAKLMILVSLLWSLTPVLDKVCLKYSSINIHGFIQAFFTLIGLYLISNKELNSFIVLKANFRLILITVIVGTLATVTQFYAILANFVPIMESIKRATGQLSAVIFGKLIFNEEITVQKIFGIIIISISVNLIV